MNAEDVGQAVLAAVDAVFEKGSTEVAADQPGGGRVVELEGLSISITVTAQRMTLRGLG
jgi:hypothetical protein